MDIILDSGLAIRTWSGGILIGRKTYAVDLEFRLAVAPGPEDMFSFGAYAPDNMGKTEMDFTAGVIPGGRSIELLDGSKPLRERAEKAIEDYNQGKGFHGHIE